MSANKTNELLKVIWDIETVRKLLRWWGESMRSSGSGLARLTYPGAANYLSASFDKYKVRAPKTTKPTLMVIKIEAAIKMLEKFNGSACMALTHKYHYEHTIEHAAKQMRVSQPTYRGWVKEGENFIAGKII